MADIYDWSTTAADNDDADSTINWLEGQLPGTVNGSARAMMKRVKELLNDLTYSGTVGGTADAITLTSAIGALADNKVVTFKASADNTGAATLAVNGLTAKAIRKISAGADVALSAGDIEEAVRYVVVYDSAANSSAGAWIIVGSSASVAAATTGAAGIVELATQTEAATLTDTSRAVTADGLFFLGGYTTTATAAGTTTLTVTSTFRQIFTGTSTQTLVLPVTSTLVLGRTFRVINNSTGAVTVQSSGANNILVVPPGGVVEFVCILTSGTSAASWDAKNVRGGLELLTSGTVSSAATLDIVLTSYAGYRGLVFYLIHFIPATDSVDLLCRMSTDGGSSYDSGASDYKYAVTQWSSTAASVPLSSDATTSITITAAVGNGSAEGVDSVVTLLGQTSTALKQRINSQTSVYTSNDQARVVQGIGLRNTAQDTDAIRFLFSSGNIASGTYAVYGLV